MESHRKVLITLLLQSSLTNHLRRDNEIKSPTEKWGFFMLKKQELKHSGNK